MNPRTKAWSSHSVLCGTRYGIFSFSYKLLRFARPIVICPSSYDATPFERRMHEIQKSCEFQAPSICCVGEQIFQILYIYVREISDIFFKRRVNMEDLRKFRTVWKDSATRFGLAWFSARPVTLDALRLLEDCSTDVLEHREQFSKG